MVCQCNKSWLGSIDRIPDSLFWHLWVPLYFYCPDILAISGCVLEVIWFLEMRCFSELTKRILELKTWGPLQCTWLEVLEHQFVRGRRVSKLTALKCLEKCLKIFTNRLEDTIRYHQLHKWSNGGIYLWSHRLHR